MTGKTAAGDLGLKDEFDWFVELVKQYFPERFHVYDCHFRASTKSREAPRVLARAARRDLALSVYESTACASFVTY